MFNIFTKADSDAIHIDMQPTEAEARDAVAALEQDFDLRELREATLDEFDAMIADFDIDGTFHGGWIAVNANGVTEAIAIVEEV